MVTAVAATMQTATAHARPEIQMPGGSGWSSTTTATSSSRPAHQVHPDAAAQPAAEQRGADRERGRPVGEQQRGDVGGQQEERGGDRTERYAVGGGQGPPEDHQAQARRSERGLRHRGEADREGEGECDEPAVREVRRQGGQPGLGPRTAQDDGFSSSRGRDSRTSRFTGTPPPTPAGRAARWRGGRAGAARRRGCLRRAGDHRAAERAETGEHLVALSGTSATRGRRAADRRRRAPGGWCRAGACRPRPRAALAGRGWRWR